MNAFDKAVARLEQLHVKHGSYPEQIDLTYYSTAETFERVHPGENFESHKLQRIDFVEWCAKQGIRVRDRRVRDNSGNSALQVARDAVGELHPYRLGVDMHSSAIGWAVVGLERKYDPNDPTRPAGGID